MLFFIPVNIFQLWKFLNLINKNLINDLFVCLLKLWYVFSYLRISHWSLFSPYNSNEWLESIWIALAVIKFLTNHNGALLVLKPTQYCQQMSLGQGSLHHSYTHVEGMALAGYPYGYPATKRRTNTGNALPKNHKCSYSGCSYATYYTSHLKKHMLSHEREKAKLNEIANVHSLQWNVTQLITTLRRYERKLRLITNSHLCWFKYLSHACASENHNTTIHLYK